MGKKQFSFFFIHILPTRQYSTQLLKLIDNVFSFTFSDLSNDENEEVSTFSYASYNNTSCKNTNNNGFQNNEPLSTNTVEVVLEKNWGSVGLKIEVSQCPFNFMSNLLWSFPTYYQVTLLFYLVLQY